MTVDLVRYGSSGDFSAEDAAKALMAEPVGNAHYDAPPPGSDVEAPFQG